MQALAIMRPLFTKISVHGIRLTNDRLSTASYAVM